MLGVDICQAKLESARMTARGVPADFTMAGAECLPLTSSTFGKCCISLGMHHLAEPLRRDALREVLRVLMPGGSLFVIDYNLPIEMPARLAAMALIKMDSSAEARAMLCQHSLVDEVQKAGFQISRREFFCCGTMQLIEASKLT
ncbi:MAG: class I SAM-dependent methyltransferase [Dehalococcoidia bacterium]|nr:class I SAM-dependent methyltransferase [Dehalococcoidia bacterium]